MKNTIRCILSIAVVATVASCAKTNVRKLSEDWKVEYEEIAFDANDGNFTFGQTLTFSDASATQIERNGPTGEPAAPINGTVQINEFIIKKDGTWTRARKYQLNGNPESEGTFYYDYAASGTWSFVRKSKSEGFSKNDRVLFNVLTEKNYSKQVFNNGEFNLMSDDYSTYLTGQYTNTYVVKSSKKDKLELERTGTTSSQFGTNQSQVATSEKLTLKAQ